MIDVYVKLTVYHLSRG